MAHVLAGQELAIDRATPKDRSPPPGSAVGGAAGRNGAPAAAGACIMECSRHSPNTQTVPVCRRLSEQLFPH